MKKSTCNRKRKGMKIFTFLMAVVIGCSPIGARASVEGILIDNVEHTDLTFEELEYYRMSEEDFDAIVADLEAVCAVEGNEDAVTDIIIAMEDYYNELMGNYSIAQIYTTLDAENEAYDEELTFYDELGTSVGDKIQICYQTIALSVCSEALRQRVDDEEWQDILDYVPMTEEQKDLFAQETELELEYDELYNKEYETEINGTSYTMEALDDAYENGTVDWNNYLVGLGDLLNQRNEEMGNLFLELLSVRTQIANSYGYDNYADYAYEEIYDRDYSPEDLEEYRQQIIEYMVPLSDELYSLLFDTYYDEYVEMWDQEMSEEESLELLATYLPEISADMMVPLEYMLEHNMYDLSVDEAKAPGGYTTTISGYNAPYMFNCADGSYSDMSTLIHEYGHYNQMYYASEEEWYYGYGDLDLAEINSQGLEVLFLEYSDEIFGEYGHIMNIYNLFNQVYAVIEGAKEDAFQYAIYSEAEGMTIERLNELYYECCIEYGGEDFYNSYYLGLYGVTPADSIMEWVDIPHTFQSPLYYVSYSVSMAAVEELRDVIMDDRDEGIRLYLELAKRGSMDSFQVTLEDVGLNNPISNPRFDVYAENIRVEAGLSTADSGSTAASGSDVDTDLEEEEEEDEDNDREDADREEEEEEQEDRDDGKKKDDNMVYMICIVICLFVLVGVIVTIIVIVNKGKKKKETMPMQQAQGMPPYQGMPMQPQVPQGFQGIPGMPVPPQMPQGQPGMPVPPQMPQGQPGMPVPPQMPQGQPGMPMPPQMPQNTEETKNNAEAPVESMSTEKETKTEVAGNNQNASEEKNENKNQ